MDGNIKKLKIWVFSISFVFFAVLCFACVSFVKLSQVRKINANYNIEIEKLQKQKNDLQQSINYLRSEEGRQDYANQQDLLPDGENEIIVE